MGSSGQSRSSADIILRASHTSAQKLVIAADDAVRDGAEEEDKETEPALLGALRGGSLPLARSAAFFARWVA